MAQQVDPSDVEQARLLAEAKNVVNTQAFQMKRSLVRLRGSRASHFSSSLGVFCLSFLLCIHFKDSRSMTHLLNAAAAGCSSFLCV